MNFGRGGHQGLPLGVLRERAKEGGGGSGTPEGSARRCPSAAGGAVGGTPLARSTRRWCRLDRIRPRCRRLGQCFSPAGARAHGAARATATVQASVASPHKPARASSKP
eukprot:353435-Chlamydomonas_euryale.AAC.5